MSSTIDAIFTTTEEDNLRVLTEGTALEYPLGEEHRLDVYGNPESDAHPFQYRILDTTPSKRDVPITVFAPPVGIFDADAEGLRNRYAAVVDKLFDADAAETFRDVVKDLGADYRAGELLVLDEHTEAVIQSVERTEYDAGTWLVYFVDDHIPRADWGLNVSELRPRIGPTPPR